MQLSILNRHKKVALLSGLVSSLLVVPAVYPSESIDDFLDMPLEDLLSMEVT
mgnify:FL=1